MEIVGTFILVFIGAGTVVALNRPMGGVTDPSSFSAFTAAIALAFGFAVLIVVYAFGHVSGAHIKPDSYRGPRRHQEVPLACGTHCT